MTMATTQREHPTRKHPTPFVWAIYADATLAGLSVLIPIPFVDDLFEGYFRRRMVRSIAQRHQVALSEPIVATVNRSAHDWPARIRGCLLWPFRFVAELVLSLSRKLLYFLSVKKAIDALNFYWQRAYLLDYLIRSGYLHNGASLESVVTVMETVLREHNRSPLRQLAGELVRSPVRLAQSVRRARQGKEDAKLVQTEQRMRSAWHRYDDYFQRLEERFDLLYQESGSGNRSATLMADDQSS